VIGRRLAGAAAAAVLALAFAPAAHAQQPERPSLDNAAAAILVDARDGTPILEKRPDEQRPIASTTKLMTALLTLEQAPFDAVYTAPDYQAAAAESKIDLQPGEQMRVRDLFKALMLESANDAAATLAEGVSGSRSAFVAAMNDRADELGLDDTSYANPIGLDDPLNYSSARDLSTLARKLLRDRRFAAVVDSPSATLTSGARPRTVGNRNSLIATVPAVDGVKTGHTSGAGYILVGSATGSNGARVVSVVLGEPSEAARDSDTLALLRYGLAQYRRVPVLRKGRAVAAADVAYRDETVPLVPARSVAVTARRDERIAKRIDAPDELRGEIPAGTRVGTVALLRDGEVVRRVSLLAGEEVPGAGPLRRIASALGIPLTALLLLVIVSVAAITGIQIRRRRRARSQEARRRTRARVREQREQADRP
jgi:serine-type D-Ala-D-Ala carboxypeptidase (penicillin-binding protein 5/6)